jgi:hypothetical protein
MQASPEGRPLTGPSLRSHARYQSFHDTLFSAYGDGGDGGDANLAASTADLLASAHVVLAGTTSTKLVGSLLLGFSLVALLENPPEDSLHPRPALANLCLGVACGLSFATTTFAMLEAHFLHDLTSAGAAFVRRERRDAAVAHQELGSDDAWGDTGGGRGLGHGHEGHGHGGEAGLGPYAGLGPGLGLGLVDAEDARLAAKFGGLLRDLDRLRGWSRAGLWAAMALLTLAVLLRLGGGDLGFVAAGGCGVLALMAAAAAPVLARLREAYAPLIKEYRGHPSSANAENAAVLSGGRGAAIAPGGSDGQL